MFDKEYWCMCDDLITDFFCSDSLNNLVLMGEDRFYFTNFYKFNMHAEIKCGLPLGNVCFYDGTKAHIVLNELAIPNGIASSPDGKYVFYTLLDVNRLVQIIATLHRHLGILIYLNV